MTKLKKHRIADSGIYEKQIENYKKIVEAEHLRNEEMKNKLIEGIKTQQELHMKIGEYSEQFKLSQTSITESTKLIEQLRNINNKLNQQNKNLRKKHDDLLRKCKNAHMQEKKATEAKDKVSKQLGTLKNLCRSLQSSNREMKAELEGRRSKPLTGNVKTNVENDTTRKEQAGKPSVQIENVQPTKLQTDTETGGIVMKEDTDDKLAEPSLSEPSDPNSKPSVVDSTATTENVPDNVVNSVDS